MSIFESNAFKYKRCVVITSEKSIKEVEEYEEIAGDVVFYMSDKTSYGLCQLATIEETLRKEKNG